MYGVGFFLAAREAIYEPVDCVDQKCQTKSPYSPKVFHPHFGNFVGHKTNFLTFQSCIGVGKCLGHVLGYIERPNCRSILRSKG